MATKRKSEQTQSTSKQSKQSKKDEDEEHIAGIVIDRSGSMETMGSEVMNGYNLFLETQAKQNPKLQLSVIRFDTEIEVLHDGVCISEIPKATVNTFRPRGMTALFDAVFHMIRIIKRNIKRASNPSNKVMIAILTDGENNQHRECKSAQHFKKVLKHYQDTHGWEFVFLAANQDAIETGSKMGIPQQKCLTFSANPTTCHAAFEGLSNSTQRYYSSNARLGFTQEERQASITASPPPSPPEPSFLSKVLGKLKSQQRLAK